MWRAAAEAAGVLTDLIPGKMKGSRRNVSCADLRHFFFRHFSILITLFRVDTRFAVWEHMQFKYTAIASFVNFSLSLNFSNSNTAPFVSDDNDSESSDVDESSDVEGPSFRLLHPETNILVVMPASSQNGPGH